MSEMGPVLDVGFERTVKVREDEVLACAYAGQARVSQILRTTVSFREVRLNAFTHGAFFHQLFKSAIDLVLYLSQCNEQVGRETGHILKSKEQGM